MTYRTFSAKHSVAQAELLGLPYKDTFNSIWKYIPDHLGFANLPFCKQCSFKLLVAVKMVLNRAFVSAGNEDQSVNACGYRLFCGILYERLINNWE